MPLVSKTSYKGDWVECLCREL